MQENYTTSEALSLDLELSFTMRSTSALRQKVTKIFELLRDPVYRYLYRVLENSDEAEDLTQEVFLRLYRHLHQGHTVTNIRAWVFRVAHNLAIDQQRKDTQRERLDLSGREEACDRGPGPEAVALEVEQQERLRQALTSLSIEEKHCLELRAEGLSYKEIAGILDMRMPTLVKYLGRIIKKLLQETAHA
ncbi:MAG TPA: RNA polymerase sigma factor [Bryobacteraceae bacterium]|jgi:RNA polymerase sigma-70 factor (ECF subfamily)